MSNVILKRSIEFQQKVDARMSELGLHDQYIVLETKRGLGLETLFACESDESERLEILNEAYDILQAYHDAMVENN